MKNTVTCDRGHEPITYEGYFADLCPLCAALDDKTTAEQAAKNDREYAEERNVEVESLQKDLDNAEIEADKLRDFIHALDHKIAALEKEKK